MVNGRNKGNKYENAICLALSRWLLPSLPFPARVEQLPFRRRSTSIMPLDGHWNGTGDILHRPDIEWPFCVECKRIEGWTLDGVFNDGWPVWDWWLQAWKQARSAGLAPMLLLGRNRKPDYVLLRVEDAACLGLTAKRLPKFVTCQTADGEQLALLLLSDLVLADPARLSTVSTASKSPRRSSRTRKMTTD